MSIFENRRLDLKKYSYIDSSYIYSAKWNMMVASFYITT